ncbi:MAG: glycosyltransferase family 39 protein [Burkholderiaceae bacterium]|nr:glycosyltransferase family 39 protein [Burkholderiaceae bacterium]
MPVHAVPTLLPMPRVAADRRLALWLATAWALAVGASLATRSLAPLDETRYVAVAWQMWQRGDFVLPWLAGAPYSHKPPLLFWLIHAGWAVFGVVEWWPRLISPLASLAAIGLVVRLAGRLWPDDAGVPARAAVMLFASALWLLMSTATMFDILLAVFVLLGVAGLWSAATALPAARHRGWALVALAIGGGLLTKGPVVLLHLLPLMLSVRWWAPARVDGARWSVGLAAAIAAGAAIALAWAAPAGMRGGEAYRDAILWGQTSGRLVEAFAHARPWWWYLPVLPAVAFPWLLWPAGWRAGRALAAGPRDAGVRLLVAWIGSTFVALSLISGKQAQYLLPLLPAAALLLARGLGRCPPRQGQGAWPAAASMALVGVAVLGAPAWAGRVGAAPWLSGLPWWAAVAALAAALLALGERGAARLAPPALRVFPARAPWRLASAAVLFVAGLQAGVFVAAGTAYDARPMGERLGTLQRAGVALARVGLDDHGSFDFAGRLRVPLAAVEPTGLGAWFQAHPDGVALWRLPPQDDDAGRAARARQFWRGQMLVLIDATQWPAWADRAAAGPGPETARQRLR